MTDEMAIVSEFLDNPPVDIEGLIHRLGIDYRVRAMPSDQSGMIQKRGDRFMITINALDGEQRQRFTAAHELAHYLLHRDLLEERGHLDRLFGPSSSDNPSSPLSPQHEVQANRLAANLLMPANDVLATWGETKSPAAVAKRFDVSQAAAEIRLKNLGVRP